MGASRRDVLKASILLPMMATAAGVDGVSQGVPMRVAVVGAGAFGGWTALELQRRGSRVTLVDAWGPGNARASSGGETRVIRATYGARAIYTKMAATRNGSAASSARPARCGCSAPTPRSAPRPRRR